MKKIKSFLTLTIIIFICSCSKPLKNLSYFKEGDPNAQNNIYVEPKIAKGDILSIIISSDNPKASELFNLANIISSGNQSISNTLTSGYLVDEHGNIQVYQLGDIYIEGLTKFELTTTLKQKLSTYLQNPLVNIRLLNFKVTVLGEVNKPGTFSIPNEKVNVLEALGLAGDLTLFGERKTIQIVRNIDGKNEFAKLDLTNKEIFNSPYFNLRQNDIVYVDVNPRKVTNLDQTNTRNIGIITGLISSIAFIITVIRR